MNPFHVVIFTILALVAIEIVVLILVKEDDS